MPWHFNAERIQDLPATAFENAETIQVPYVRDSGPTYIPVEVMKWQRADQSDSVEWFLLRPNDEKFFDSDERLFSGAPHPYHLDKVRLQRDSVFFGAAVARALPVIDSGKWVLFLQDWECATVALALADMPLAPCRIFLTLHNSYDSDGTAPALLERFGINPQSCPGPQGLLQPTILERALPLIEPTIFTVAEQFATEFTKDVLMAEVMAPHLCDAIGRRIVGVNNGPFELHVDVALRRVQARYRTANDVGRQKLDGDLLLLRRKSEVFRQAAAGDYNALWEWRREQRRSFLGVLGTYPFSEDKGEPLWGDRELFTKRADSEDVPWFVFGGRDDSRQRGHDVAARAITDFLERGGAGQFLFLVIPGDEEQAGLRFLEDLANASDGQVLALPFLFRPGYLAALGAAAYGVFPSLYEPFGSANEYYFSGTVGIARATGGLLQQIVPLRAAASYSRAVDLRATRWHNLSSHPTGILYRERDEEGTREAWAGINAAAYDATGSDKQRNRVHQREQFSVFTGMARELRIAFEDGIRVYQDEPETYTQMLVEGLAHIRRTLCWDRAAEEYLRLLT